MINVTGICSKLTQVGDQSQEVIEYLGRDIYLVAAMIVQKINRE